MWKIVIKMSSLGLEWGFVVGLDEVHASVFFHTQPAHHLLIAHAAVHEFLPELFAVHFKGVNSIVQQVLDLKHVLVLFSVMPDGNIEV